MKRQSHQDVAGTGYHTGNYRGGARDDPWTNQSGFDPVRVESLLDVNERDKSVLVTAEAQGVYEAEGHGVGTPAETALGKCRVVENVGGQCEHKPSAQKL